VLLWLRLASNMWPITAQQAGSTAASSMHMAAAGACRSPQFSPTSRPCRIEKHTDGYINRPGWKHKSIKIRASSLLVRTSKAHRQLHKSIPNNKEVKFQTFFSSIHLFGLSLPSRLIYIVRASVIWSSIPKHIGSGTKTLDSYIF